MPERCRPDFPTDADVDALLYEFKNDAREAIRALLSDVATLAEDYGADVSFGYVRGEAHVVVLSKAGTRFLDRVAVGDVVGSAPD